jgi:hypothetical protein
VSVRPADGGSPELMLYKAIRCKEGFSETYLLLDTDIPLPQSLLRTAKAKRITIIQSSPCIEGELLSILKHPGFNRTSASSDVCKRTFHQCYLSEDDKMECENYGKFFPKNVLDACIDTMEWIKKIVSVFG